MTKWKSEKRISSSSRSLISPGQNTLNVEFPPPLPPRPQTNYIQGLSVFSGSVKTCNDLMAHCCSYQVAMQYADKSTGELLKKLACRGMCACVSVCPGTCIRAFSAIGVVLKRFFIFVSYPTWMIYATITPTSPHPHQQVNVTICC